MRRYEGRPRQLLERNRLRGFLKLASRWKQAEEARAFLDALTERMAGSLAETIGDRTVSEWIAWTRERLAAHDPLEPGATAVFRTIAFIDPWTYRGE